MWHQPFISRFLIFCISTHTSRVGCDTFDKRRAFGISNFYSHIPCGMWQRCLDNLDWSKNISTHTSRVGCDDIVSLIFSQHVQISTHTSLVGCDHLELTFILIFKISTHTSRVGCDTANLRRYKSRLEFLLTHPVWDVTLLCSSYVSTVIFLLTHPVWDVTHLTTSPERWRSYFYSHIPCGMWLHSGFSHF